MERIAANGATFEVHQSGEGEPVLLIHGSLIGADAYVAMAAEESLADYGLIRYNRRGYCGSTGYSGPTSIREQADDAGALITALGIDSAHIVGHSYGALIALQLTHDSPDKVRSLALFEPPLNTVPSTAAFQEQAIPVFEAFQSGDRARTVDLFCQLVAGPEYRSRLQLPGKWPEDAEANVDGVITVEFPSEAAWGMDADFASRIRKPILSVVGAESFRYFWESHKRILEVFPDAQERVIPGTTHGLQMMEPSAVAGALAEFLATVPVQVQG